MLKKIGFIIAFLSAVIFHVQAAQVALSKGLQNQITVGSSSLSATQIAEKKATKISFFERLLLKKMIKKINKTLGVKETKLNESLTRAGVVTAAIGLLAFFIGYVVIIAAIGGSSSSGVSGAAALGFLLIFLGWLANIIGVILAFIGISAK
jgi:hypothetical protein